MRTLYDDLSGIDRAGSGAVLYSLVQSGDIRSREVHSKQAESYPGLFNLPPEIMEMLKETNYSEEFVKGAGIGALLVVRVLIQYAEASRLET